MANLYRIVPKFIPSNGISNYQEAVVLLNSDYKYFQDIIMNPVIFGDKLSAESSEPDWKYDQIVLMLLLLHEIIKVYDLKHADSHFGALFNDCIKSFDKLRLIHLDVYGKSISRDLGSYSNKFIFPSAGHIIKMYKISPRDYNNVIQYCLDQIVEFVNANQSIRELVNIAIIILMRENGLQLTNTNLKTMMSLNSINELNRWHFDVASPQLIRFGFVQRSNGDRLQPRYGLFSFYVPADISSAVYSNLQWIRMLHQLHEVQRSFLPIENILPLRPEEMVDLKSGKVNKPGFRTTSAGDDAVYRVHRTGDGSHTYKCVGYSQKGMPEKPRGMYQFIERNGTSIVSSFDIKRILGGYGLSQIFAYLLFRGVTPHISYQFPFNLRYIVANSRDTNDFINKIVRIGNPNLSPQWLKRWALDEVPIALQDDTVLSRTRTSQIVDFIKKSTIY